MCVCLSQWFAVNTSHARSQSHVVSQRGELDRFGVTHVLYSMHSDLDEIRMLVEFLGAPRLCPINAPTRFIRDAAERRRIAQEDLMSNLLMLSHSEYTYGATTQAQLDYVEQALRMRLTSHRWSMVGSTFRPQAVRSILARTELAHLESTPLLALTSGAAAASSPACATDLPRMAAHPRELLLNVRSTWFCSLPLPEPASPTPAARGSVRPPRAAKPAPLLPPLLAQPDSCAVAAHSSSLERCEEPAVEVPRSRSRHPLGDEFADSIFSQLPADEEVEDDWLPLHSPPVVTAAAGVLLMSQVEPQLELSLDSQFTQLVSEAPAMQRLHSVVIGPTRKSILPLKRKLMQREASSPVAPLSESQLTANAETQ